MVADDDSQPFANSIDLDDVGSLKTDETNTLTVRGINTEGEKNTVTVSFMVTED